ncbi:ATP-binding cassette domain-containing protein [Streptomyces sp. NBC_01092]|uniref:ATP-binding cassette domain-containing protein n=1 Tax=Streptomyces sp. NBC_01092 TaxID=2903748 RepID=UPI0038660B89|nr:ATP-binding cassette domain-containing protein [Streptomyces sp. NBC_01092]
MALLDAEGIRVSFGGVTALDGVSIEAPAGRITGLIGPNGSGKTTLFNAISGLIRPDEGRIVLNGRDVTSTPAHVRSRLGICRTFQRLELFETLTVGQNVLAAAEMSSHRSRRRGAEQAAQHALQRVGLANLADQPTDQLPTGSARLLELARTLAAEPRLLLLDEPAAGLNDTETQAMGRLLQQLADEGLAIILAEHDMTLVMAVSHVVNVLDFGRLIASAPPAQIRADPAVHVAYLGAGGASPSTRRRRSEPAVIRDPALELQDVWVSYGNIGVLSGLDLTVHAGQILALLGPNGAGKSTILRVIAGQLPASRGAIRVFGHDISGAAPDALARAGVCLVPDGQAVFPNLTVDENLQMATFRHRSLPAVQEQAFTLFPRLAQRRRQLAGTLSGGEQRMLAVTRVLTPDTAVLLLDELSAGLSPRLLTELYENVLRISEQGVAVLLVEQYAQTVLAIADTAALLINGRIRGFGAPEAIEQQLLSAYLGDLSDERTATPRSPADSQEEQLQGGGPQGPHPPEGAGPAEGKGRGEQS